MIHLLRASHANEYELQNYSPIAKKHKIQVITSHHPLTKTSIPQIQLWSPTDLPNFPYRRQIFNRLFGGEQWLIGLNNIVKHGDIIHTAETYTPYTHQAVELKRRGLIKKLICTCWETIPHNNEKLARLRRWKQEAYQYVDLFHTPTQRAKQALVVEGVPASKIKVIPYGVDLSQFTLRKCKFRSKPLVLALARRVPEKGLSIFAQLQKDFDTRAEFRWVSDAPYEQVPQLLHQADIFLLASSPTPTWEEQYGMVLVEAMATGLPIITTTCGAIPEIVGDTALLTPPNNYAAIATHLNHLLSIPPLAPTLARAAQKRAVTRYDRDKIAPKLANLYR